MGSKSPETGPQQELDDSGYVHDETSKKDATMSTTYLLDLSDDVLLYILSYCSPQDLKALGYTCSRLASLILDRTLWQRVDARGEPSGILRVQWLLTHALNSHTTALLLSGYAREAEGCLGFMSDPNEDFAGQNNEPQHGIAEQNVIRIPAHVLPRYGAGGGVPYWPEQPRTSAVDKCPGPQPTMTLPALLRLGYLCPDLSDLALEYCVIDCVNNIRISMFPQSLRRLSLRGTKCYNMEKTFLFRIQDTLTELEELDVSCCDWVEPSCLLALSKVGKLSKLIMCECPKLSEFVAYASLATRYGFRVLKILDLRGSPVGDSEVSALGWVPNLEELYLSPATAARRPARAHSHQQPTGFVELHDWEDMEPEYFITRSKHRWWEENYDMRQFPATPSCMMSMDPLLSEFPNMLSRFHFLMNRERRFHGIPPEPEMPLDPRYIPAPEMLVGPRDVPAPELLVEPRDVPAPEMLVEPRDVPAPEMPIEPIDVPAPDIPVELRHVPAPEMLEEPRDVSAPEMLEEPRDVPAPQMPVELRNVPQEIPVEPRNLPLPPNPVPNDISQDNDGDTKRKSLHPDVGPFKRQRMGEPCATKASLKYFDDEIDQNKSDNITTNGNHNDDSDDDDNDNDDKGSQKVFAGPTKVNQGASTSKSADVSIEVESSKLRHQPVESKGQKENVSVYVDFGRNDAQQNNNDRDEPNLNSDEPREPAHLNPSEPSVDELMNTAASANSNSNGDESNVNTDELSTKAEANSSVDDVYSSDDSSQPSSQNDVQNKSTNTEPEEPQESVRRVFYVNVARGRPSMYQISLPIQESVEFQPPPDINVIYSMWPRLEFASLVTDSAIRRFGRADGDIIRYVHIGNPLGAIPAVVLPPDPRARPDRSNLRILSVTGFQNITDVSLRHLATAAPRLEFLDFTGTAVTELGVEHFRNLQPNCEVRYGPANPTEEPGPQP